MDKKFTLSLLIYSGRENPTVSISETEFDVVLSLLKAQQILSDCNFAPNLGDVGFSFYSINNIINIYNKVSTIETKSNMTYFLTNLEALKKAFYLFFKLYKGDDLNQLKAMVNNSLFLL